MMELQRLPIVRMDDEVLARDGKMVYDITNPKDIPDGVHDGIFSIDRGHGTARFESRQEKPPYVAVDWKHVPPKTLSTSTHMPQDGTVIHTLCGGRIILTIKPTDQHGELKGYAEGEGVSDEILWYTLALALAGVEVDTAEFTEGLESFLLFTEGRKS